MIEFIYNDVFIKNNELVFYIFIGLMLLIFLTTIYFVVKEVRGNSEN